MDFQELKLSLSEMEARLQDIKDNVLFVDNKKTRLNEIDSELSKEEVWSDLELSQKLSKEKTTLEKSIKSFDDVSRKLSDSVVLLEVSIEENDDSSIDDILNEICEITLKFCYFSIATAPAKKVLSDGRNAHIIQKPSRWWLPKLCKLFNIEFLKNTKSGFIVICKPIES